MSSVTVSGMSGGAFMSAPVKFSPSERHRRPPLDSSRTEKLTVTVVVDEAIDLNDGLIGEDNPPVSIRRVLQAPRPR